MTQLILIIAAALFVGYALSYVHSHRQNRLQCLNCGSHKTNIVSWVSGSGGGNYTKPVKTWEYHCCKDCDARITVDIKLVKD